MSAAVVFLHDKNVIYTINYIFNVTAAGCV